MVLARSLTTTVATVTTADIPQVVSDLDDLDSSYRAVQPCITALLARVALIDQTVIALPSSAAVRSLHTIPRPSGSGDAPKLPKTCLGCTSEGSW